MRCGVRLLLRQYFDAPLQKFAEAMVRTVEPRLAPLEFVARFTFANGALNAVYRHGMDVARSAHRLLGSAAVPSERDWVEQIVAFCAAGLKATVPPSTSTSVDPQGSSRSPKQRTDRTGVPPVTPAKRKANSASAMKPRLNASKERKGGC